MTTEYGAAQCATVRPRLITNARAFAIIRARHTFQPGAREKRHGQESAPQQQGKEETEGRQEPQEGRRDAVAVLVRKDADAGRPKPDGQEGLRSGSLYLRQRGVGVAGAAGVGDDHRNQQVLERDIAADLTGNKPGKIQSVMSPG